MPLHHTCWRVGGLSLEGTLGPDFFFPVQELTHLRTALWCGKPTMVPLGPPSRPERTGVAGNGVAGTQQRWASLGLCLLRGLWGGTGVPLRKYSLSTEPCP